MRIDMHAHYVPPKVVEAIERDATSYGIHLEEAVNGARCACFNYGLKIRPFPEPLLDLDKRWQVMASMRVDRQILSGWADLFGYGMPAEEGARWCRLFNETLGEVAQHHGDRLSALATAPLQDAQLAARELEYGVKQCGAVGGVIAANVDEVSLGETDLDAFWATAVALDVPIFIHPAQPQMPPRTGKYGMLQVVQFTYDTTASVGSLIFSGVLDRFPTLKLILSHGGGYYPYQAFRFDRVYRNMSASEAPSQAPSAYRRRFYYDTVLYDAQPLGYLKTLVGSDRMMLGTDYPFPVVENDPVGLLENADFTTEELAQVCGGQAKTLFRL
jgi:aminocarboxymuconate-semialdehyde decarboxylase